MHWNVFRFAVETEVMKSNQTFIAIYIRKWHPNYFRCSPKLDNLNITITSTIRNVVANSNSTTYRPFLSRHGLKSKMFLPLPLPLLLPCDIIIALHPFSMEQLGNALTGNIYNLYRFRR